MMHAAQIVAPGQTRLCSVDLPDPAADQVRVRLKGCGVCASNLELWHGQPWFEYPLAPGAPGHEGWGVIDAVGSAVDGWQPGQLVGFISQHAYAEYDLADPATLVAIPPALADLPLPLEPLGCAMNIFRRAAIQAGETVAIVGIGFLGTLLTQLATQAGAHVIALSRRSWALEQARAAGAATTIMLDDHWRTIEQVRELTAGQGCSCVIEAVGKQWPLDLAAELTAERARLVIAGYHQDGPRQVNMQLWNWRGLDVINAHERDPAVYHAGMLAALDALATQTLDIQSLLTHRFTLATLDQALQATVERPDGFMKAWLCCESLA